MFVLQWMSQLMINLCIDPTDFFTYVSSLLACAHPHLKLQLDWGDLIQVAHHMLGWEEKLSTQLCLTDVDIHDITKGISNLELQRYREFVIGLYYDIMV